MVPPIHSQQGAVLAPEQCGGIMVIRLQAVVENTREILHNVRVVARRTRALEEGDPFFVTASLRWYLELQGRPWPEPPKGDDDARDSEPGRG